MYLTLGMNKYGLSMLMCETTLCNVYTVAQTVHSTVPIETRVECTLASLHSTNAEVSLQASLHR